ncbi:hypothetical protein ES703_101251 [subsurface metagenome]
MSLVVFYRNIKGLEGGLKMKHDRKDRPPQGRGLPPTRRIRPSIRVHLEDCTWGILIDMTKGREDEFVPIRILDIQNWFRDDYFINLNEGQVSYLLKTLANRGIIEREIHNRDRSATSWKDQLTRYRLLKRS